MDLKFVTQVFFLILFITRKGDFTSYDIPVRAGQRVNLPGEFPLHKVKGPPPPFVLWSRFNHGKKTLVAFMRRKSGSSWEASVADNEKFAVSNDTSLVIKRMDARLAGKYVQHYHNTTYVSYHVRILQRNPRVDVLNVRQRYEEASIPNGVKRKFHINFTVSTGRESDCRKTVDLCRRNSTKQSADKEKCEVDEIMLTLHTSSCQFTLEYNDTRNATDPFQMYLMQFSPWDVHDSYSPQLFLLSTKNRGISPTDPLATTTGNHRSETTTISASSSLSKTQVVTHTPKGPTVRKEQGIPLSPTATTTHNPVSQTLPQTSVSKPKETATTPTLNGRLNTIEKDATLPTNPARDPSSSGVSDSWVIVGICFAVIAALVIAGIVFYVVRHICRVRGNIAICGQFDNKGEFGRVEIRFSGT